MLDVTFFKFVEDNNKFKSLFNEHIVLTDFRDYETYMFVRAMYNIFKWIPFFKIFFQHQIRKIAKENRRVAQIRMAQIKEQKASAEFKEKVKVA